MSFKYSLNKKEMLFFGFFSLITIGKSLGLNADNKFLQFITVIAIVLLIAKLAISKFTLKELIIDCLLVMLGLGIYYATKREGVLLSIITIIGLKDISYKKLFSLVFKLRTVIYISLILLSLLGIIKNMQLVHWRDGVGYVTRYGLGYDHPNLLHSNLFILVVLFIYLYYEKLNVGHYICILIFNGFIYRFSVSRTGFYSVIGVVLVTFVFRKKKNIGKNIYRIILLILPVCVILTVITALTYNKIEFVNVLDELFTGRINYSNHFLINYPVDFFGYNLSNDSNLLDNGYVMLLINYGGLIFVLYILGYYKIIKKFIKLRMDKELLLISFFTIYGTMEGYIPNIFMNLSLVFLSDLIFNINRRKTYE